MVLSNTGRFESRVLTPQPLLGLFLVVAAVAFGAAWLARAAGGVATIWPANGVLLAFLLTAERSGRPRMLAAGTLAGMAGVALAGFPLAWSARVGLVNLAEVGVGQALLSRYFADPTDLSRPRVLWAFALIAAVLMPALSTLLSAGLAAVTAALRPPSFIASYLAHALGMIATAPIVLAIRRGDFARMFSPGRAAATVAALATLLAVTAVVFAQSRYPLLFLVYPPLVLVAVLRGLPGGGLGLFLATVISLGLTLAHRGPVTLVRGASTSGEILLVQVFAEVAAILVLVICAILAERDRAAEALEAAQEELLRLATVDGLTGLANRRRLDQGLDEEWRRAARDGTPLSFLLLDIDRFKSFNDTYGHQRGDECLRAAATAIKSFARRAGELAARYGGEEMALILPNTDAAAAETIAESVRAAIAALALRHDGNARCGGVVTASIGAATSRPAARDGGGPDDLVAEADAMLYEAKRGGRNRIMCATRMPTDPTPPALPQEEARAAAVEASLPAAIGHSAELDSIARLAAQTAGTPIGLISLVGRDEQVFVGRYGLDIERTAREVSFCAHAIIGDEPMIIPNATEDPRFAANPLVTGGLGIRFYAGAPMIGEDGLRFGAVCVIDRAAHNNLSAAQRERLAELAELAMKTVAPGDAD